ncbi:MAG: hypothetical protein R2713_20465 [Ilumatobacteraceae bacterium]
MKAALLVESLTGNTWKAGEKIGTLLQQDGWTITGPRRCANPITPHPGGRPGGSSALWVHGLFVVGQAPWVSARSASCR